MRSIFCCLCFQHSSVSQFWLLIPVMESALLFKVSQTNRCKAAFCLSGSFSNTHLLNISLSASLAPLEASVWYSLSSMSHKLWKIQNSTWSHPLYSVTLVRAVFTAVTKSVTMDKITYICSAGGSCSLAPVKNLNFIGIGDVNICMFRWSLLLRSATLFGFVPSMCWSVQICGASSDLLLYQSFIELSTIRILVPPHGTTLLWTAHGLPCNQL